MFIFFRLLFQFCCFALTLFVSFSYARNINAEGAAAFSDLSYIPSGEERLVEMAKKSAMTLYKDEAGISETQTLGIITERGTGRKFLHIKVNPDGDCVLHTLGSTRKEIVDALVNIAETVKLLCKDTKFQKLYASFEEIHSLLKAIESSADFTAENSILLLLYTADLKDRMSTLQKEDPLFLDPTDLTALEELSKLNNGRKEAIKKTVTNILKKLRKKMPKEFTVFHFLNFTDSYLKQAYAEIYPTLPKETVEPSVHKMLDSATLFTNRHLDSIPGALFDVLKTIIQIHYSHRSGEEINFKGKKFYPKNTWFDPGILNVVGHYLRINVVFINEFGYYDETDAFDTEPRYSYYKNAHADILVPLVSTKPFPKAKKVRKD